MANLERKVMWDHSTEKEEPQRDLPSLLQRLAEDLSNLFDQKVSLLKLEVREDVDAYVRGSIVILAGGIVAAVGFALANVALAFFVSTLFVNTSLSEPARYALGFILTGILYLLIGPIVIVIAKDRLARQGLLPRRTINELERDKEWIQREF
jgi:uncharacterized membrane protein YqjE